jgi:transcriptional regulator with XRE-family HTH domain
MGKEKLGSRVKNYRERKGIQVDELAARAGLKPEFVRSVEDDDVYPSLGPLLKISRALGQRLGTFLDDHAVNDPLVVRQGDRSEEFSMLAGKAAPIALRYFSLGKGKTDRHMEPFFIEIFPESAQDKALSSHEGEEFIVVTEGQIEVTYGKETSILGPGDSVYFNSIVPHHVCSAGGSKASIYAVLYLPD